MTAALDEIVEDLDAALLDLAEAPTPRAQRRAMREAIGLLYVIRCFRAGPTEATESAYRDIATLHPPDGHVAEVVAMMRGTLTHDVVAPVGPVSADVLSDTYTETYGTLAWLSADELDAVKPIPDAKRRDAYRDLVAGRPVIDTLNQARAFLVDSPSLGPLA